MSTVLHTHANHRTSTEEGRRPYEVFCPLMKRFGATCSPKAFYWAVNDALHAAEAAVYDDRHATMYLEAGGAVWERLLSYLPDSPQTLRILDVGCGTGLVGHFMAVHVPHRVESLTLMDPCANMIAIARKKAASWPFDTIVAQCHIESLDVATRFDVVTINSVLHHVVELEAFVKRVQDLVKPGGLLLTGQDPRALAATLGDAVLAARRLKKQVPYWDIRQRLHSSPLVGKYWGHIARSVRRLVKMEGGMTELARKASSTLLAKGIVSRPMDETSLYTVTDVHVPRQVGKGGEGIDENCLLQWMTEMTLVAMHTYRFHDAEFTHLSAVQRDQELAWWRANDPHGATMALVFQKKR